VRKVRINLTAGRYRFQFAFWLVTVLSSADAGNQQERQPERQQEHRHENQQVNKPDKVFDLQKGFSPQDYLSSPSKTCSKATVSSHLSDTFQVAGMTQEGYEDGYGVVYQSMFKSQPDFSNTQPVLSRIGDLRALLLDQSGRLRSDNGDRRIGSVAEDPVVSSCFDQAAGVQRYRLNHAVYAGKPLACNALHFSASDKDIGYLWRASEELAVMSDAEAVIQRAPFQNASRRRHIRTHIGQQEYDFAANRDYPFKAEWFGTSSKSQAEDLINYVRGQEKAELRQRKSGQEVFRLGDTRLNQPVYVGRPNANFHLIYGDQSYQQFQLQYQHRRSRLFLSSHDGMLHAFNAGWYDPHNRQVGTQPPSSGMTGYTDWALGQELWAFVPFDLLPLLGQSAKKWDQQGVFTQVNLLTQTPYVFDARVFSHPENGTGLAGQPDRPFRSTQGTLLGRSTHPGGWGTLLVMGFGFGGGQFSVKDDQGVEYSFKPGYLVFDITDAEQAPMFLALIQPDGLGSSLALPSAFTLGVQQDLRQWYLALGSGADLDPKGMHEVRSSQPAKLFIYDLSLLQQNLHKAQFKTIELPQAASYIGGISAADWQLNGETDALYVTTASFRTDSLSKNWQGALYRISTATDSGAVPQWQRQKMLSLNAPLSYRPVLSMDVMKNRWIYVASGRTAPGDALRETTVNAIVGFKEPRYPSGEFAMDAVGGQAYVGDELLDVSAVLVNQNNGELSGSLSVSPPLDRSHVLALEQRLMQYRDGSRYLSGWYRAFDLNEVATMQGYLYGGMLSQPSYRPGSTACQSMGNAYLHTLRFTTGTAWYDREEAMKTQKTQTPTAVLADTRSSALGRNSLTGYLLQIVTDGKEQSVHVLMSDRNGYLDTRKQSFIEHVLSGEISWRAL
jgi:hypothetical protein